MQLKRGRLSMPIKSAQERKIAHIPVLLAGESDFDCESLKQVVRDYVCGCEVVIEQVDNPAAMLERVRSKKHDVVLLDPDFCKKDILRVITRVRQAGEDSFIIVVKQLEGEQGLLAIKHGANDFLSKGQTLQELFVRAISYTAAHKAAQERLKAAVTGRLGIVPLAVHELRTPLACMKGAAEIVLSGITGRISSDQHNLLEILSKNVDRLARLLEGVMDLQDVASAAIQGDLLPHDVADIIEEVRRRFAADVNENQLNLVVDLQGDIPKVPLDRNRIIQALLNLLDNARKFTPNGGQVCITAHSRKEKLLIQISDTGAGMPKESLVRIFEPFYRAAPNGGQAAGAGLGLTIANEIVAMHGGAIRVESKINCGTTFTIVLPLDGPKVSERPCLLRRAVQQPEVEGKTVRSAETLQD